MNLNRTLVVAVSAALMLPSVVLAEKDRFEVGEDVEVFTLKTVNPDEAGERFVSIDKYYGEEAKQANTAKKAVLLSFFATYCEPCKKEMPYLAALHNTYEDKGLQVLLVSIDKEPDKVEMAKALAKEHGVAFPVLSDRFNIVAKRYFIQKLPCIYIINGEGKVAMVNVGYSGDVSKALLDEVRKQIGEPAGEPIPEALKKYLEHTNGAVASAMVTESAGSAADGDKVAEASKATKDEPKSKKKKRKKRRRRKKKK